MSSAPSPRRRPFDERRIDVGKLFDKNPPSAIEAEISLLGSLILDWRVTGDVLQILDGAEDFYKPAHQQLYSLLVDLYDQQIPVDLVQINQRLVDMGQLEAVGGLDYVVEMVEGVPSAASAAYYAKLVRDKAVLR